MKAFLLLPFFFLLSCNPSPDCDLLLMKIRDNFESGNFRIVYQLSDSLEKVCDDDRLIYISDSIAQIAERITLDFSVSENQLIMQLQARSVSYTSDEISGWEKKGWLEARIINGEKMYFRRTVSNLILLRRFHEQNERNFPENSNDPEVIFRLNHSQEVYNNSGDWGKPVVPVVMKIKYTVTVHPDAVPEGEKIRCWMPWPKEKPPRQQNIKLLSTSNSEYNIAPDSATHSSIFMKETAKKGVPTVFSTTFLYQSSGQHFNTNASHISPYNKHSEQYKKYTVEQLPQICFTENIKRLADSIVSDEENPDVIVRKIYYWFKDNIPWTGALEYSIMPNMPEYVYQNRRGDCGMQTFLFMSMLRYKGIPVRWQSGWMVPPDAKNLHDWCEVYFEGMGWVPVDISYNLQPISNRAIREFYISGIDSYRLIVNEGVAGRLHPEKWYLRSEPYDFQRGEVEWEGGNLYFDKWDYSMEIEYIR
jgi:hypothetical protein